MGVVKKAKHEAKAAKRKGKKDAGKVKHKGKKVKCCEAHDCSVPGLQADSPPSRSASERPRSGSSSPYRRRS